MEGRSAKIDNQARLKVLGQVGYNEGRLLVITSTKQWKRYDMKYLVEYRRLAEQKENKGRIYTSNGKRPTHSEESGTRDEGTV